MSLHHRIFHRHILHPLPNPFSLGCLSFLILILILLPLTGCGEQPKPDSLLISAAANLQPVLTALTPALQEAVEMDVAFNYSSSGKLAQQIEQGAPVDLFLSANREYVEELISSGVLAPDSMTPFAYGKLVVWTRDDHLSLASLQDLTRPEIQRIAMPNPDHAPYGAAARQALQSAGLWDVVQPKLVFGENVTQSYQFAQAGDVEAAFVSASQVISEKGRWIAVPPDLYPPLEQTAAVAAHSSRPDAAQAVIQFLLSPTAQDILRQFGYLPINEASS